jgi:putative ABC transport system permease protein
MSPGRWLISRLAPRLWRDSLLGDLEEERHRRLERRLSAGVIWWTGAALAGALALRSESLRSIRPPSLKAGARGVLGDVRWSLRSFRAAPGFTAVALLVLTLGLGLTTAIYSVVDAVLLRDLPFEDPDRLVAVGEVSTSRPPTVPASVGSIAAPNYLDFVRHQTVFESIGAAAIASGFVVREGAEPENLMAIRSTASLFQVLRLSPAMGALFTVDDEVDGRDRVALIGDHVWRGRFGADPAIVGRTLTVDAGTFRIIGVLPPGFTYPVQLPKPVDVVAPYVVPARERVRNRTVTGRNYNLRAVARLRDGVTVEQARADITRITAGLARDFPDWFGDQAPAVHLWHDNVVARTRGWMLLLLGAVACVMLIACANVANLLLARGTGRSRDLLVRSALGASRWRLARGLVIDGLVLSGMGLVLSIVAALWGVAILRASMPVGLPRLAGVEVDLRVLAAASLLAVATGLVSSLVPALQLSRPDLAAGLRSGLRAGGDRRRERIRSVLVVVEVALATVLLVGAALFAGSFARTVGVDLGLDPRNVIAAGVNPRVEVISDAGFQAARQRTTQAIDQVLERLRRMPQVSAVAAIAGGSPLSGSWRTNSIAVPGKPEFKADDDQVQIRAVSPGYLDVVRVPLRLGRYISDTDTAGAPLVVVLNEEAMRRFFDGQDPVGTMVRVDDQERLVVGVVGNVRLRGPEVRVSPEAYLPLVQAPSIGGTVLVRTDSNPAALVPAVKAAVLDALPGVPVTPTTLEESLQTMLAPRRFNMLLVGLFGVVGVAIAALGLYGVMAFVVAQRTRELGVRIALGADPRGVLGLVLTRACALLGLGLAAGLGGAWVLAGTVETYLFGVGAREPVVFVAVAGVLTAAGLLAAALPARRAARIDPIVALRAE